MFCSSNQITPTDQTTHKMNNNKSKKKTTFKTFKQQLQNLVDAVLIGIEASASKQATVNRNTKNLWKNNKSETQKIIWINRWRREKLYANMGAPNAIVSVSISFSHSFIVFAHRNQKRVLWKYIAINQWKMQQISACVRVCVCCVALGVYECASRFGRCRNRFFRNVHIPIKTHLNI